MLKSKNNYTSDINWLYFKIPGRMLKRIRRAKGNIRVEAVEAQAKSLLTNLPFGYYLKGWSWSELEKGLQDQEFVFAEQLASFWRKKYKEQKKLLEKRLEILKEKAIKSAFTSSKLNKKTKKQQKKQKKKGKQAKKKVTKTDQNSTILLYSTPKCSLCLGKAIICDMQGVAYPCPKCSQQNLVEPVKRISCKVSSELGKRKVRF